jgi:hypothetical protein
MAVFKSIPSKRIINGNIITVYNIYIESIIENGNAWKPKSIRPKPREK